MRSLEQLNQRGQSPWYDNLSISLIRSGRLQELVDSGIRGVTSNPTIFDNAISSSSDYDEDLKRNKTQGNSPEETYWDIVCRDISLAADILKPTYDMTQGLDGYVSVEVSPKIARSAANTIAQASELYSRISRDNVMIKIPATLEGITAIEDVLASSIPVNVTLIFSQDRYSEVVGAYKRGIQRAEKVQASVASFFVSRLDSKVDSYLDESSPLCGKAAIANAGIVYSMFSELFENQNNPAQLQRPLWASTSTKNPSYSPTLYVDSLIANNTVNTLPQNTIDAIYETQEPFVKDDLSDLISEHEKSWTEICSIVPMDTIMKELEDEGVSAFERSYESCISSIAQRLEDL